MKRTSAPEALTQAAQQLFEPERKLAQLSSVSPDV
jgi:hypothetical protein